MSKIEYKKKGTEMVTKAAFKYFTKEKEGHKKVKDFEYKNLKIQPYLKSKLFNNEERNLLYSLRSKCHPSKYNFKKMHKKTYSAHLVVQKLKTKSMFLHSVHTSKPPMNPHLTKIFLVELKTKNKL